MPDELYNNNHGMAGRDLISRVFNKIFIILWWTTGIYLIQRINYLFVKRVINIKTTFFNNFDRGWPGRLPWRQ